MSERQMTSIERRIVASIARIKREGLEPKSIYLTPDDFEELTAARGPADQVGGLVIKRISGKGRSRIYCRHGIDRAVIVPRKGRRA